MAYKPDYRLRWKMQQIFRGNIRWKTRSESMVASKLLWRPATSTLASAIHSNCYSNMQVRVDVSHRVEVEKSFVCRHGGGMLKRVTIQIPAETLVAILTYTPPLHSHCTLTHFATTLHGNPLCMRTIFHEFRYSCSSLPSVYVCVAHRDHNLTCDAYFLTSLPRFITSICVQNPQMHACKWQSCRRYS